MIPLMVGILKLGQHQAHGTSLVALVFTGLSGAITYAFNGSINFTAALCLAQQPCSQLAPELVTVMCFPNGN